MRNIIKQFKYTLRLIRHSGNEYICPLCHYNSRDFFPIGLDFPVLKEKEIIGGGIRNAGCYKCGSSDRGRLIYAYLKHKLKLFEKSTKMNILHIAPEKEISEEFLKLGYKNYICGDLHAEGYSYPAYVQNMTILNLPFDDNSFDLIICNHVLEHVIDDITAMSELYRVLKKKGTAILQVPISKKFEKTFEDENIKDPKLRQISYGQFDHVRIYGQDYTDRLKSVGFEMKCLNLFNEFPKYGLNAEEDIFLASK